MTRKNLLDYPKPKGFFEFHPDIENERNWRASSDEDIAKWAAVNGSLAVYNINQPYFFYFLNLSCKQVQFLERRQGVRIDESWH